MKDASEHMLRPQTPADHADLFAVLEAELREDLVGDPADVIQPLALLGVRHLAGHAGLRCLIHGQPGSGKSTAARVLADLLGAPCCRISLAETAETTWKGADITDQIDAMRRELIRPGVTLEAATALASRAIVLVDDMDVLRLEPYRSYGDSDRGQRVGRQQSLLSLWSGEAVPIGGADWIWRTERVLVIGAGEFEGADAPLDSAALLRWGLSATLAERVTSGTIVHMRQLPPADVSRVACREAYRLSAPAFEGFGYRLFISPEASHHALLVCRERDPHAGVRAVAGLLRRSADRLLIRMVLAEAPVASMATLAPDDLC
jgi:hypothetical protein